MKKICFFDLETTGVNHWENGIIQLSGIIDINGKIVDRFDFNTKPVLGTINNPKTMEFHNLVEADLEGRTPPNVVLQQFKAKIEAHIDKYKKTDKMFLAGYNNAHFDNQFLRNFFLMQGDKYYGSLFWANPIDVMVLASYALMNHRDKMANFKLATVAGRMGIPIEEDKLHDAMYDVELTRALFYKLARRRDAMLLLIQGLQSMFEDGTGDPEDFQKGFESILKLL